MPRRFRECKVQNDGQKVNRKCISLGLSSPADYYSLQSLRHDDHFGGLLCSCHGWCFLYGSGGGLI